MENTIKSRLKSIEEEHGLNVLYAVESGSRAWGIESTDSDWDVRFIYERKPESYLKCVGPKIRDTITILDKEIDDLDFHGWDIDKAVKYFYKQNPSLLEWMLSPIVYKESDTEIMDWLLENTTSQFRPISASLHYMSMCRSNYKTYLLGDEVPMKKYLYAIRPLLCCMWIMKYKTPPPMLIQTIIEDLKLGIKDTLYELLDKKKSGVEMGIIPKIKILDDFLIEGIEVYSDKALKSELLSDSDTTHLETELNSLFFNHIKNGIIK